MLIKLRSQLLSHKTLNLNFQLIFPDTTSLKVDDMLSGRPHIIDARTFDVSYKCVSILRLKVLCKSSLSRLVCGQLCLIGAVDATLPR